MDRNTKIVVVGAGSAEFGLDSLAGILRDAVDQCVAMCGVGGDVVMLGGASRPRPIDLQGMLLKEVNILSSNSYSTAGFRREFQIAMNMLRDGQVDHESLVTHRFPPEEYRQALDVAIHKSEYQAIKPMFIRE